MNNIDNTLDLLNKLNDFNTEENSDYNDDNQIISLGDDNNLSDNYTDNLDDIYNTSFTTGIDEGDDMEVDLSNLDELSSINEFDENFTNEQDGEIIDNNHIDNSYDTPITEVQELDFENMEVEDNDDTEVISYEDLEVPTIDSQLEQEVYNHAEENKLSVSDQEIDDLKQELLGLDFTAISDENTSDTTPSTINDFKRELEELDKIEDIMDVNIELPEFITPETSSLSDSVKEVLNTEATPIQESTLEETFNNEIDEITELYNETEEDLNDTIYTSNTDEATSMHTEETLSSVDEINLSQEVDNSSNTEIIITDEDIESAIEERKALDQKAIEIMEKISPSQEPIVSSSITSEIIITDEDIERAIEERKALDQKAIEIMSNLNTSQEVIIEENSEPTENTPTENSIISNISVNFKNKIIKLISSNLKSPNSEEILNEHKIIYNLIENIITTGENYTAFTKDDVLNINNIKQDNIIRFLSDGKYIYQFNNLPEHLEKSEKRIEFVKHYLENIKQVVDNYNKDIVSNPVLEINKYSKLGYKILTDSEVSELLKILTERFVILEETEEVYKLLEKNSL